MVLALRTRDMSDKDQFLWMAHEITADLKLTPEKERELAHLLEEIARHVGLTPDQLLAEAEKRMPAVPDEGEGDQADWWKQ